MKRACPGKAKVGGVIMNGKKPGLNTVSQVLQQPNNDPQVRRRKKSSSVASSADFQLNSLGGPLQEDFS